MRKMNPIYALLTVIALLSVAACNSTNDGTTDEELYVSGNTLVTKFSLQRNDSVLASLDSVFFTIDAANRIIYNADSLPKGTKIDRLLVSLSYASGATAKIKVTDSSTMEDTTYTYSSESTTDSIDFNGNVTVLVTAANNSATTEYRVKVNVHKVESDSLYWDRLARRDLPARTASVKQQKTTQMGAKLYTLIQEGDDTYTIATTEDPAGGNWEKSQVTFGFVPDVKSFWATDKTLFLLANDGQLYRSADGKSWTATTKTLHSITGNYASLLLGVSKEGDTYYKEALNDDLSSAAREVAEADFPVEGSSQTVGFSSDWATSSQVFFLGGRLADGSLTGDLWGFDGKTWGKLSNTPVAACLNPTLIPYWSFSTDATLKLSKYAALLAVGGTDKDGVATKTVSISLDSGITWKTGDELLQLPDYIAAFSDAQAFVYDTEMSATRAASYGWTPMQRRKLPAWWQIPSTRASQPVTSWNCPYIYMFGGVNGSGVLQNNIWKGVINRLTFKPII